MAEFAYDALGRRIKKVDSIASETNIYYYNDKWQVLCEYDGSDTFEQWFAYGNYIDEVLMKSDNTSATSGSLKLYVHDHLYSPVALVQRAFLVLQERYEYDAYGNCQILSPSYEPRATSDENNPYLFTGRRLDILDNGSLKLQYNRNRYYDQYTGRWMTHDPLGITPNPRWPNEFDPIGQYRDELGLYLATRPMCEGDPYGLFLQPGFNCLTAILSEMPTGIEQYYNPDAPGILDFIDHSGLLIDGKVVDFGPKDDDLTTGKCPFNSPPDKSGKRWDLYVGYGKISVGPGKGKPCCRATLTDIKACLKQKCSDWHSSWYILGVKDCHNFVWYATRDCCLRRHPKDLWPNGFMPDWPDTSDWPPIGI